MARDPLTDARFAALWTPLADRVEALVRRQVGGSGLNVDELVQEVRLRLWKALGQGPEKVHTGLALYARQAVISAVVDALRARARRAETQLEDSNMQMPATSQRDPAPTPERYAAGSHALAAFRAVLTELPERRRQPVLLLLQGFAPEQIGRMLGLTADQARNLAYRGLESLRSELRARGFEPEGTES